MYKNSTCKRKKICVCPWWTLWKYQYVGKTSKCGNFYFYFVSYLTVFHFNNLKDLKIMEIHELYEFIKEIQTNQTIFGMLPLNWSVINLLSSSRRFETTHVYIPSSSSLANWIYNVSFLSLNSIRGSLPIRIPSYRKNSRNLFYTGKSGTKNMTKFWDK